MSTVLFLVGYGLALPPIFQWARVIARRSSLALAGHQFGMGIAMLAWFLRGRIAIGVGHLVWMVAAKIWFEVATKKLAEKQTAKKNDSAD